MRLARALAATLLLAASSPAFASSSDWLESEGGRVRIVTTGTPDASGKLAGALVIDLKPGWKTYWRDPGEAGVPPSVDVSATPGASLLDIGFPAPKRFDDGYSKWAGYKHPVTLPLTFDVKGEPGAIQADIFLGVCETICIPVQGWLELDPASDPGSADDAETVKAAVEALPDAPMPDFGATVAGGDAESLTIAASVPDGSRDVELFLASGLGYTFDTPRRHEENGRLLFTVPILDRPASTPPGGLLHYTLTTAAGAVAGILPAP